MMPIKDNIDVASYLVTKHSSWKGKYKRIFAVGTSGITTYNPDKLEITNRWLYSDVICIQPTTKHMDIGMEFTLTIRKEKKVDTMRFSSEYRAHILTDALKFRSQFAEKPQEIIVSIL